MIYTIEDNPYEGEYTNVFTKGVSIDAKAAKLNNATKRPVLVTNWEKGKPKAAVSPVVSNNEPKDYNPILAKLDMVVVDYNHINNAHNNGAKKLRVNEIVNTKTRNIYNAVKKEEIRQEDEKENLVNQINALSMPMEDVKREDVHGRHEHTGEIPVNEVKEAIRNEIPQSIPTISRMERNTMEHESVSKLEPKAGDIDLYNNLLHNGRFDDVSRQLQGAKEELSIEKEESKKLAEQYSKAVRELEELKLDIENKRKMKAQQERRELSETLNNLETLKKENIEKTSDLSSIQNEIAKLRAERQQMESNFYGDTRTFGRRAA